MRRTPLIAIYALVLVDAAGYGMVVPLLPLYAAGLGVSATGVGLLTALYAAVQLVALPAIGALADRHGRRAALLACVFGTALAYLVLAAATSPALLVCALALDALTGGNLSVAQALVAERAPREERAAALGRLGAAFALGVVAGPALGGLLAAGSARAPILAAAALALVNVAVGLVALPRRAPAPQAPPGDAPPRAPWRAWRRAADPAAMRLLLTLLLVNLAFAGLHPIFPLFTAARFGWRADTNGLLFALVGACAVLAQGALVGPLQARLGAARLAIGGLAALALGLAALGAAPAGWALPPAAALAALGSSLAIPALSALLVERADPERHGALLGLSAALLSLAQTLGPAASGATFEHIGPAAPFGLGAALATGALLAFARDALGQPVREALPKRPAR